jgi:hypothetical protein
LIDAGLPAGCPCAPSRVRGHCSHELAFCVLSGLARSYLASCRRQEARHACRLRLALPIDEDLRATVRRELGALEGG